MRISRQKERWFPCEGDPDEGSVLIKHLSPGEAQDIIDEVLPQKIDYELDDKGNMVPQFSNVNDLRPRSRIYLDLQYSHIFIISIGFR